MNDWKKFVKDKFEVTVTPKASSNRIKADVVDGVLQLKVYVTVPPEDGKANKAVIELLAKELRVPKSSLTIVSGLQSRRKVVRII